MGRRLVLALAASVAAVAGGLVAVSTLDLAAMFADDAEAALDAGVTERRLPLVRPASVRRAPSNATPAIRVLNTGTVDSDPERHDARVQDMVRAATAPGDAVTADDDLDQAGTVADWFPAQVKTYRTVCVRLCDGALTPISFSTTRDRFALDALRCRKSCGSPVKLYIQRNPASNSEGLVDLDGQRYAALDTAFKFRTSYDNACTCRAHAWESLAQSRHRIFKIQDQLRAGRQIAQGRIVRLKLAAVKSARYAARLRRPDGVVVTGSANGARGSGSLGSGQSAGAGIVAAAVDGGAEGHAGAAGVPRLAVGKSQSKVGKAKRGKAYAQAKSKAARGVAASNMPLLVLFGQPSEQSTIPASKLVAPRRAENSLLRADVTARRYDGSDWRISTYEPL